MSGASILTEPQISQLIAWRERGRSYAWIAGQLGVSAGAVHYQCLKQNAVSPRQRGREAWRPRAPILNSDGRTQRRFTPDEDEQLLELEAQGLSIAAIAKLMDRPRTSVRIRLMTLAQHEEIAA
jgi:DNA-directed RNA polymerase specialized sigma24 family protein